MVGIFKAINRTLLKVQAIDNGFKSIGNATTNDKITALLTQLKDKPEITNILSRFLTDLNKIGINQTINRHRVSKAQYYIRMMKFRQLHGVFWQLCHDNDISQRSHKLRFNINNLGLLDPKNFPTDVYKQLTNHK